MNRFGIYGLILAATVVVFQGCSNEKKLLRQQVAAQADTLFQLKGGLLAKSDSLENALTSLEQARMVLDSVNGERESFQQRIRSLNSQLKQSKEANDDLRASLDKSLALRDSVAAYFTQALADSTNIINQLRSENSLANSAIRDRDSLLAEIRPWYMKWKHDAHRSFIKVLFGAGKAAKPEFPEPELNPPDGQ